MSEPTFEELLEEYDSSPAYGLDPKTVKARAALVEHNARLEKFITVLEVRIGELEGERQALWDAQ